MPAAVRAAGSAQLCLCIAGWAGMHCTSISSQWPRLDFAACCNGSMHVAYAAGRASLPRSQQASLSVWLSALWCLLQLHMCLLLLIVKPPAQQHRVHQLDERALSEALERQHSDLWAHRGCWRASSSSWCMACSCSLSSLHQTVLFEYLAKIAQCMGRLGRLARRTVLPAQPPAAQCPVSAAWPAAPPPAPCAGMQPVWSSSTLIILESPSAPDEHHMHCVSCATWLTARI